MDRLLEAVHSIFIFLLILIENATVTRKRKEDRKVSENAEDFSSQVLFLKSSRLDFAVNFMRFSSIIFLPSSSCRKMSVNKAVKFSVEVWSERNSQDAMNAGEKCPTSWALERERKTGNPGKSHNFRAFFWRRVSSDCCFWVQRKVLRFPFNSHNFLSLHLEIIQNYLAAACREILRVQYFPPFFANKNSGARELWQ